MLRPRELGSCPSPVMMMGGNPQILDGRVTRRKEEHRQRDGSVADIFPICKDFIYLFIYRQRGREEEKRNINVCLPVTYPLWGGGGLQPRHVP